MTEAVTVARSSSETGIVGNRHLVAVQTFDIARLTTHAVPLVPGTFVAASGQGPKGDSNGSGKTSFLAAASLLLGEAQWRLEGTGSQYAANLLFKPESAGLDPNHRYAQADHGYIVGVFAEPENPEATALTVWLRIASASPYVKVRWTTGLHIAVAETDVERYAEADALWEALPRAEELGPKRFAAELYGQAPRCMAYLDTPMRPSAPSLLSQQMTEMSPARIGDALIELTGRQGLLETEEEQRSKLADQKAQLKEKVDDDNRARLDEQTDLDGVHHRNRARDHLADGEHMWRLHFAKGYIDNLAKDHEYGEMIDDLVEQVSGFEEELELRRSTLDELHNRTDFETREAAAKAAYEDIKTKHSGKKDEHSAVRHRLVSLSERRNELLPLRDGWTGLSPDQARAGVNMADRDLTDARLDHGAAERRHARLETAHEQAQAGGGGSAGSSLELLRTNGIRAALLLDEITLAPDARRVWEPRLWPYRDAIVVGPGDEQEALALVAGSPGVQVVVADRPFEDQAKDLPDGVSANVPIGNFLAVLGMRSEFRADPDRDVDVSPAVSTLGGFAQEIAGRAARIAAAQAELGAATRELRDKEGTRDHAQRLLDAAKDALAAALAVEELGKLTGREAELNQRIQALDTELAELAERLGVAQETWVTARAAAQSHEDQVKVAAGAVRLCGQQLADVRGKLAQRQQERDKLILSYWLAGWADTTEAARDLIEQQPDQTRNLQTQTLRRRAAERLKDALDAYVVATPQVPPELAEAQDRRQRLADGEPGVAGADSDFTSIARPLRDLLDSRADADQILEDRITRSQRERTIQIAAMTTETESLDAEMDRLQDAISSRVEASLHKIGVALDRLNRARGGFGAELKVVERRPDAPTTPWKWEVTPRWRRSPTGGMVSYREVANGAQVKVFAIQLVLAALLAADGAEGRMLVLDELGNSLGDVNRKDVLRDLNDVAAQQGVTILGTCQDSVIGDAAGACGEILWFRHQAHTEPYNHPTRVWGYDTSGERVELVQEWLTAGRGLV